MWVCLSEDFWERPHDEPSKNVRLEKLDMGSSPDERIQVSAMRRGVEIDVKAHKDPLIR